MAGSVGTMPECGGVVGLTAGSVVAGYWQLAPRFGGGVNAGSCSPEPGEAVWRSCRGMFSAALTTMTANTTASTTATIVSAVIT